MRSLFAIRSDIKEICKKCEIMPVFSLNIFVAENRVISDFKMLLMLKCDGFGIVSLKE